MEKFSYAEHGYNIKEVNNFVQEVIKSTEDIIKRCEIQRVEIATLKKELDNYHSLESSLNKALIKAEEVSDNIKRLAREEAEIITGDAKNNASRIVNEALLRAEKIENRADTLERNMKIFKRKLKMIMEEQQAVVDEIEVLELDPK